MYNLIEYIEKNVMYWVEMYSLDLIIKKKIDDYKMKDMSKY